MAGAKRSTETFNLSNPNENGSEIEEIELDLGLSMNGRFGVDPAARKKLKRASSISNVSFVPHAAPPAVAFESYAPLVRTRSLPMETEEMWRRRKEMEARRKRMEKMKNVRVVKGDNEKFEGVNVQRALSQGSIGSFGSGSSGSSDLENYQIEGAKQNTALIKSPSNLEQESAMIAADRDAKTGGKNESPKNPMLNMPHVTTKLDGPNGNKIEGFLYQYKKGEEVRIVCVCHGMFLSPAEFVKHGGGGDVEQPLKHIVVNTFPLL